MGLLDCLHRRKNKILSLEEKLESLPVITPSLVDGEVPYERTIYERALIAHGQGGMLGDEIETYPFHSNECPRGKCWCSY